MRSDVGSTSYFCRMHDVTILFELRMAAYKPEGVVADAHKPRTSLTSANCGAKKAKNELSQQQFHTKGDFTLSQTCRASVMILLQKVLPKCIEWMGKQH